MTIDEFNRLFPQAYAPGIIQPFMHKGEWAIHDVLPIVLSHYGHANVMIATFSISEDSLRPIYLLKENLKLQELYFLFDTTIQRHKLPMLLFAREITPNIRIASCHAKILLIEHLETMQRFGIVGSANLNQNARYEAGFYFTSGQYYDYFKNAFTEAYSQSYDIDR